MKSNYLDHDSGHFSKRHSRDYVTERADFVVIARSIQARLHRFVERLFWYVEQMVAQFLDHDCPSRAGALTYTTLFAVVPMMTVAYAMFSIMPAFEGVEVKVEAFLFKNLVPASSSILQDKLGEFSSRARELSLVGGVFLFLTTFLLLVTIEKTLNVIWNVADQRKGLQRFLVYWGVMSLGPPMIGGGILISVYLTSLPLLTDLDVFGIGGVLLEYSPMMLTCLGFTILYYAVPNCSVPFLHALLGGILTMGSFEIAKIIFNLVVANSSTASVYGAFAAIPFFLLWMYMVWVLILAGAIFVRTLSLKPESMSGSAEPVLVKCARVLQRLYEANLDGKGVSDTEIADIVSMNRAEHEQVLAAMMKLNLLVRVDDQWLLGRNLKGLTLWDLYQTLPEGLELDRLKQVRGLERVVEPLKSMVQFGSNQMSVSLDSVFGGVR